MGEAMLSIIKTALLKTKLGQLIKDEYVYRLNYKNYKHMRELITKQSPEAAIRSIWGRYMKYPLCLDDPQTFNEKLQWLKLNWYDERATMCANKHLVREYVKSKGLEHILVKQLGLYTNPAEIDFSVLPNKFVIKPSHDSGHTIICTDKTKLNIKKVKDRLDKWLSIDYEYMSGEWPYKSKKYIISEEFLEDKNNGELMDYKIHCFNGKPVFILLVSNRTNNAHKDFFDLEWNPLPLYRSSGPSGRVHPKPSKLNDMIEYAKILSEGFPFVRVDFYQVEGKVYFGELTFFPGGGLASFQPASADIELGSLLTLPRKSNPWGMLLSQKDVRR
jgi:hypothetical protein